MHEHTLLVVDDELLVIESVRLALKDSWRVIGARSPSLLPDRGYQVALVDMHLSERAGRAEGIDVIRRLRAQDLRLEIIAMSGQLDRAVMEQCLDAGATRFLAKPLSLTELTLTLGKIEALFTLQNAVPRGDARAVRWVGDSEASRRVLREIAHLRDEHGPILIEGESGSGKEVCAQLIHSQQAAGPLVAVNVASVPETLFESELFGHVKGAFTGADQNKIGLAEAASGGDLFLDEIEALSLPMQAKLLRFIESGEIRRVGGRDAFTVHTRVIAASNRSLKDMVAAGQFREDLLWRLSGKKIELPSLRERPDDIPELARHFLARDSARRKELGPDALEAMTAYHWPGNVRELKRVCEQLSLTAPLPILRREDVLRLVRPGAAPGPSAHVDLNRGLAELVGEFEGTLIRRAIETLSEVDDVAKTLKISRSSLYKKIKDYDLTLPRRGGD